MTDVVGGRSAREAGTVLRKANEKKLLIEYNKMRESGCLLEGKSESTWLRPQRRHYPQSNRPSPENYVEEKREDKYDAGRNSWITIIPTYHREKKHFPEKNHAIFGKPASAEDLCNLSK
uniref:Uncharacterized protein n=1 Tax=Salvator merianae TaxID=96440 RepID=A0A8D0E008_SALMN